MSEKKLIRNLFYGKKTLKMNFRNVSLLYNTFLAEKNIVSPIKNAHIFTLKTFWK